jgi:hypothetical protein
VARIVALYRYPVKSMRGDQITGGRLYWHGLEGDRRYAFVRGDDHSGFPWLTARQIMAMVRYVPAFSDPDRPRESPVTVRTPEGIVWPVESDELLEELASAYRGAGPIALMQLARGAVDSANVSLISTASVGAITTQAGVPAEARRFRPNIVVETLDGEPFGEERWVGRQVVVGERPDAPRIHLHRKDVRCMMINLNPETGRQDPAVLRTVVSTRDECAGIYGSVMRIGEIQVGDMIRVVDA